MPDGTDGHGRQGGQAPTKRTRQAAAAPGAPTGLSRTAAAAACGAEPGGGIAHYATEMIVHTRPDRTRSYVSPGARNLLGYAPHEIIGRDFATFLHPGDRARVEREYAGFQRQGGRTTSTYRLRHRDGRYIWVESNWVAVPAGSADGAEPGVVAVVRDITGRKRDEAALKAALHRAERAEAEAARVHARLCDAIEAIPAGFVLFDAERRLVLCNSKYRDIYPDLADRMIPGITADELTGLGVERGQFDIGGQAPTG